MSRLPVPALGQPPPFLRLNARFCLYPRPRLLPPTHQTTVGYGDITPVTTTEQVVAVGFMAFAVFYFG